MTIFFYSSEIKGNADVYQKRVEQAASGVQVNVYRNIEHFTDRLGKPMGKKPIVILYVRTKDELFMLLASRDVFLDVKLILILPEDDNETVALGHRFHPNFVTYVHSEPSRLIAVLNKLIHAQDH